MTEEAKQPDGLPEKIGNAVGVVAVIAVFATLAWNVLRGFL